MIRKLGDFFKMQVKLWGVRGSLPSAISNDEYRQKISRIIQHTIKSGIKQNSDINNFINDLPEELKYVYGGNTTCITVTSKSGELYIIDCGTGIRLLGNELLKGDCGKGKGNLKILLTHNHFDHVQGLPFFKPLYIPGNVLNFHSPYPNQKDFLNNQMNQPYFPATFESTASQKNYIYLDPKNKKPIKLENDLTLEYYPLNHPGGSFAYKFKQDNKIFIFATDAEFSGEILEQYGSKTSFFQDADLLILDSQYTLNESFMKIDWGHTSYTMAVNCGIRWNIKNLVLTHHEPDYTDSILHENYKMALEHRKNSEAILPKLFIAREGMVFKL